MNTNTRHSKATTRSTTTRKSWLPIPIMIWDRLSKAGGRYSSVSLQSVDYKYNIRGWLTGLNTDANGRLQSGKLFSYSVKYNDPQNPNALGCYNGNISEVDWKTGPSGISKRYNYRYDLLNRLVAANYRSRQYHTSAWGI
jgi:hypothetical protein